MNQATAPKFIIKGKGEVKKSPLGRYLWEVLDVAKPAPEKRQRLKGRIGELLWVYLQGEFGAAQRRDYIYAIMEELEIDRRDEDAKRKFIDATLKVCSEFEKRDIPWPHTQNSITLP